MKIIFVVNTVGITGGIKVIFEHANQLIKMNNNIIIVHLLNLDNTPFSFLIALFKKIKYFFVKDVRWFNLSSKVKILHLINYKKIPKADVYVATANETAQWVDKINDKNSKKFYFVQDYEIWTRNKEYVDKTYKLPLQKIVISTFLKKILLQKFNENSKGPIMNGVDFDFYKCEQKKQNKNIVLLMQYHILKKKGVDFGLHLFDELKQEYPDIKLLLFGSYRLKHKLPKDSKYFYKPSQDVIRDLYHKSDIFLWTSQEEGFGMPPMEAMAGKCAVVSFDVGAIKDYARNNNDALIVKKGDVINFKKNVIDLIINKQKREQIALSAYKNIQQFKWENASKKLLSVFSL